MEQTEGGKECGECDQRRGEESKKENWCDLWSADRVVTFVSPLDNARSFRITQNTQTIAARWFRGVLNRFDASTGLGYRDEMRTQKGTIAWEIKYKKSPNQTVVMSINHAPSLQSEWRCGVMRKAVSNQTQSVMSSLTSCATHENCFDARTKQRKSSKKKSCNMWSDRPFAARAYTRRHHSLRFL